MKIWWVYAQMIKMHDKGGTIKIMVKCSPDADLSLQHRGLKKYQQESLEYTGTCGKIADKSMHF